MKKFVALFDMHFGKETVNIPGKGRVKRNTHDLPIVRKVLDFVDDFKPDTVILGGDQLNCGPISHWHHGKPRLEEGTRLVWEYDLLNKEVLSRLSSVDNKVWITGNHECASIDTKFYTEKGWTSLFEIDSCNKCLSLNREKNTLEWADIQAVIYKKYTGNMVEGKGRHFDFRVTDNHNLVGNHSSGKTKSDLFEAGKFSKAKYGFLKTSAKINTTDTDKPDALYSLLGWFYSDGGIKKTRSVTFYQGDRKVDQIEKLLNALSLDYKKIERVRKTNFISRQKQFELHLTKEASSSFAKFIPSRYELPAFLFDSSARQIRLFLDGYILGDGTRVNGNKNSACIYLYKDSLRDAIEQLCVLAGYRMVMTEARPNQWHLFVTDREGVILSNKEAIKEEYVIDELVWCLKNKNDTLVFKRNGKIGITGNCWINDLVDKEPGLEGLIEPENYLSLASNGWQVVPSGCYYRLGKLYFYHGDNLFPRRQGGKFPVEKAVRDFRRNLRFGHYHSFMGATDITPIDIKDQHTAISVPALCRRDMAYMNGVPSCANQGFLYGYVRPDGSFNDYVVFIVNGKFTVEGKTYGASNKR